MLFITTKYWQAEMSLRGLTSLKRLFKKLKISLLILSTPSLEVSRLSIPRQKPFLLWSFYLIFLLLNLLEPLLFLPGLQLLPGIFLSLDTILFPSAMVLWYEWIYPSLFLTILAFSKLSFFLFDLHCTFFATSFLLSSLIFFCSACLVVFRH